MKRPAVMCGILAAAFLLRTVLLGRAPLWADEIHTLEAIALPLPDLVRERLAAGHVPLYFVLEKGWCALFGAGAVALRLPSALLGTALILPGRALLRRLSRDEGVADLGALILAVSPLFVGLSREARMYPLLGLLFLILGESALAALATGRVPVRFFVAAALGPLVHATWAFPLLALLLFVAFERQGDRAVRRTLLASLVASSLLLALGAFAVHAPHPDLDRRSLPAEIGVFAIRLVAGEGVRKEWLPFYLALLISVGGVVAAGWRWSGRGERRFSVLLFVLPIAGPVAAGLIAGVPYGPVRYSYLAFLPLALLAARGLVSLAGGRNREPTSGNNR